MSASIAISRISTHKRWVGLGVATAVLTLAFLVFAAAQVGAFPETWNIGLRAPLDQFKWWVVANRQTHPMFLYFFEPLSASIDWGLRRVENFLLWLPWPVIVAAIFLIAHKAGGLRLALVVAGCTLLMGLLGFWDRSMQTLSLMVVSVIISLQIGIPLGIWSAQNDRVERALRPLLDAMQTMPAFVYLIPVLLFFGIARVPSVVATVIYALPPVIRLTNLGIRQVSGETVEAARAFGSTDRQILFKVRLPLATPAIMTGVNQTIMMALSIVVIAALIGGGGLGETVLRSLRTLNVGTAFAAGLAIVFMAFLLDRLSQSFVRTEWSSRGDFRGFRLLPEAWRGKRAAEGVETAVSHLYSAADYATHTFTGRSDFLSRRPFFFMSMLALIALLLVTMAASTAVPAFREFPTSWHLGLAAPIDALVKWAQVNLYRIGDSNIGTGPFSDFITIYLLAPLRLLLVERLTWPVVMGLLTAVAYAVSGKKLALYTLAGMFLVGLLGMWELAMDTLSQVIVAVIISVLIGIPLGIWAARNDHADRGLRVMNDFLQTIPVFVYLVPVVMLFNVGRVAGILASVLYALPPVIRLTSLGIRRVEAEVVEAANAFGSTDWQILAKVQIPLALPAIMLGVNQTIMMVLAMVICAGLVGGAGLGLEVVSGLAQNELGRSIEAGLAIVVLAVIIDRISQAWAGRLAEEKRSGGAEGRR
jgi:glycine betaine/proline transport system permease protein